jgi:murein DD-endopeptidase MepM/ murein hydrolase activator NlpD
VHKGIDIFAPAGRPVVSGVPGVVVFRGQLRLGGKVVAVLGPKWRIHYFAHLQDSNVRPLEFVARGEKVGSVGTTGNAAGKAPHLHYAIVQLIPRVWKATEETQGWKRMFFVDPGAVIGN